jgi:Sulfotransferase family
VSPAADSADRAGRPTRVRIDDLEAPRYTDDVRAILLVMEEAGAQLSLEPEPLMEAAVDETGLDDFGPTDFVERLQVLCCALRDEGGFNGAGVLQQHTFLSGLLKNRLLVEDLVRRHPEILDERIEAPIVICGLPRTGTTHLHNLMSADPALRSLPYWESLEPVLSERERPAPGEPDPRLERTAMALSFLDAALPYFKRMHEMTVDHAHEEIQLLAIDFSTMLMETIAPMPSWRDAYLARDQRPSYAYLRKVLQVLQWLRGGTRWVLKSPQHLEQFPALRETFPDATFVVTHRDPVSVTASMVTMLAYSARLTRDHVDVVGIGNYWADRLACMLRACAEGHDVLPEAQTIDVHFDEFMADDMAMVARVYELAGQPMDDQSRAAMAAFMNEHPRGRHGAVAYDLAEFGLHHAERREALSFYTERFGVTPEFST